MDKIGLKMLKTIDFIYPGVAKWEGNKVAPPSFREGVAPGTRIAEREKGKGAKEGCKGEVQEDAIHCTSY